MVTGAVEVSKGRVSEGGCEPYIHFSPQAHIWVHILFSFYKNTLLHRHQLQSKTHLCIGVRKHVSQLIYSYDCHCLSE